jgi:hypothetical protein
MSERDSGRSPYNWRNLFRPVKSVRDGTMPAGLILVIMLLGLFGAMFLNADATLRKSEAKGDGWRNEVASIVATVSDGLGVTSLRGSVDEALGKNQGTKIDVAELLAKQQAAMASQQAEAAGKPPVLPAATPGAPLRLWVGGDSITQTFGTSFQRISASTGVLTPTLDYRVSTGLSRPDFFNWPEHLVKDVLPANPHILVIMFGANDGQNMTVAGGKVLERYGDEWMTEYRRRVAATMDLLKSPANDRLTMWVGAPPMGPGSKVRGMDRVNYIYWSEAQTRPWIQYFDSWPFFSNADLQFAASLPNADGVVRGMRQKDNVHFSTVGGDRLSWAVIDRIGKLVNISAGKVTPPTKDAAPPGLVERTEIPPTMPGAE